VFRTLADRIQPALHDPQPEIQPPVRRSLADRITFAQPVAAGGQTDEGINEYFKKFIMIGPSEDSTDTWVGIRLQEKIPGFRSTGQRLNTSPDSGGERGKGAPVGVGRRGNRGDLNGILKQAMDGINDEANRQSESTKRIGKAMDLICS